MKKLLFALLLIPFFGESQPSNLVGTACLNCVTYPDTVRVLMELCDTSGESNIKYHSGKFIYKIDDSTSFKIDPPVFCENGYMVYPTNPYLINDSNVRMVDNTLYLDADKNPLPSGIVVWNAKQIN